jgi:fructose-specific component phosphotransferase system IIB-like protein
MDRTSTLARLAVAVISVLLLGSSALFPASASSRLPSKKVWENDVAHAMAGSHRYLDRAISGGADKYAINLDIDNTSVASHYSPGHAVRAVRSFARYARRHGVAVLFNTGRYGRRIAAGRRLLRGAGFHITELCGRARASEPLARGKQRCRAHFVDEGYTIVANVGNNRTDFSGTKDYGRAFRLPNYGRRLG